MTLRVYTHQQCLEHDAGPGHPERAARLHAVLTALGREPLAEVLEAAPAERAVPWCRVTLWRHPRHGKGASESPGRGKTFG